jgi:hypothetical protein
MVKMNQGETIAEYEERADKLIGQFAKEIMSRLHEWKKEPVNTQREWSDIVHEIYNRIMGNDD